MVQPDPADVFNRIKEANSHYGKFSLTSILTAMVTSLTISTLLFIGFCIFRPHNRVIYEPRLKYSDPDHACPEPGKSMFGWIRPLLSTNDDDLIHKIGLDAVVFLIFWKMCRDMLIVLSAFGVIVLLPINITANYKTYQGVKTNVRSNFMWAQIIFGWIFTGICVFFLHRTYSKITRHKVDFYLSKDYQRSLHARTLMINDVPRPYQFDEQLARLAMELKNAKPFSYAHIGRDVHNLPTLVEMHQHVITKLEKHLARYLKDPAHLPLVRPSCRHSDDAIGYYAAAIRSLEREINEARNNHSLREPTRYGFVSYPRISDAHQVALANASNHSNGISVTLAPQPRDIIWKNMGVSKGVRLKNRIIGNLLFFLLCLAWQVPNTLIVSFITNINNLGAVWPWFQMQLNMHSQFWAILQGILGPMIVACFFLFLPSVLRRISVWQGELTKTRRENAVLHKLYFFFILNNFIILTLFGILWGLIQYLVTSQSVASGNRISWIEAIKNYQILDNISYAVISTSSFWIMYLNQRIWSCMLDLLQLWQLVYRSCRKRFAPTPREIIKWSAPPIFETTTYLHYALFYMSIALVFSIIAPILLPFSLVYFATSYYVYKYAWMYVFQTKVESGGAFWRVVFNRFVFAICMASVIWFVVVWINFALKPAFFLLPLPVIMLAFKVYCRVTFDKQLDYFIRDSNEECLTKPYNGPDKLRTRYGHPSLSQKLWIPMVHAKASHLLPQVYQGRLDDGEGELGKVEIVDENDINLDKYINREDFYNKPWGDASTVVTDTMSEYNVSHSRGPGTPASEVSQDFFNSAIPDREYGDSVGLLANPTSSPQPLNNIPRRPVGRPVRRVSDQAFLQSLR